MARAALERAHADVLLSASGLYNRMEHTFRRAARRAPVPVVAVLDSWLNYAERFQRVVEGQTEESRPDSICVIDQRTWDGLCAAGFSPDQLILTGPPNLEAAARRFREADRTSRAAWRAACGFSERDVVVAFFSDPFSSGPDGRPFTGVGGLCDETGRSLFGYTAVQTLDDVLTDLEHACAAQGRRCRVVVKPHPLEHAETLRPVIERHRGSWLDVELRTNENAAFWIVVSDVVIGMMSIALFEASLAGRPALSVQVGLRASGSADPCMSNALGYTLPLYERTALRKAMADVAAGRLQNLRATPEHALPIDGAAARVAGAVLKAEVPPPSA